MSETPKEYDEEGRVIRENRSAIKREREVIRQFAETLLKLPAQQYALLPISAQLAAALVEGKRLTGNPLRRHLNYLTRLLDEHPDLAHLRHVHEHINHPYLQDNAKQQRIAREIERLLAGDKDIYAELYAAYADFDMQYVRQLVREAHKHSRQSTDDTAEDADAAQTDKTAAKTDKYRRRLHKYLQGLALHYDGGSH